ncbi:MAG: ABC transporter substrate-binding protein [Lachnospiraceae bacterium]|nr:ABC transporter substrate-binding protein [Lachnospiraceae bacterium]
MKKHTNLLILTIFTAMLVLSGCTSKTGGGSTAAEGNTPAAQSEATEVNLGALKGPTSIGIMDLVKKSAAGETQNKYNFTMETQADALLPKLISGELDIALIPANVASVLYNKTSGGIAVIDINTLGVLYMVSGDKDIKSISDLSGKTVYTTGKGTTPEYVLTHILEGNALADKVTVEYKSEASEVAAVLTSDPSAVGMLPQPFVTATLKKNADLSIVLDMTQEWDKLNEGSSLVTGVTVVRREFLEAHKDAVEQFLKDHESSVNAANSDAAATAALVVEQGIIENAAVAESAIPYCHLVCIRNTEMQDMLSGYLSVLYSADASSVGGALPKEDLYYIAQ